VEKNDQSLVGRLHFPGQRVEEKMKISLAGAPTTEEGPSDGEDVITALTSSSDKPISIYGGGHGVEYSNSDLSKAISRLNVWAIGSATLTRKFLVMINPKSGKGDSKRLWEKEIEPLMKSIPGITFDVITTTHGGHAREYILASKNLSDYSGLLIVSGDGLVHETLDGLRERGDNLLEQLPIGHLSGGTGNGLIASMLYSKKEPMSATAASLLVLKNKTCPLDLWEVQSLTHPKKEVCFLSISWGYIADLDLDSEVLRWLGSARLTIYAVKNMLRKRVYSGKIRYVGYEADAQGEPLAGQNVEDLEWKTFPSEKFLFIWAMNVPLASEDGASCPSARCDDGFIHVVYATSEVSRYRLTRYMLALEEGNGFDHMGGGLGVLKCRAFELSPEKYSNRREGYVNVDGELFPFGPIRVTPMQGGNQEKIASPTDVTIVAAEAADGGKGARAAGVPLLANNTSELPVIDPSMNKVKARVFC